MKQLLHLIKLNKKVVFPDVKNIEKMMLLELYEDAISAKDYAAATTDNKDIEKDKKNLEL